MINNNFPTKSKARLSRQEAVPNIPLNEVAIFASPEYDKIYRIWGLSQVAPGKESSPLYFPIAKAIEILKAGQGKFKIENKKGSPDIYTDATKFIQRIKLELSYL